MNHISNTDFSEIIKAIEEFSKQGLSMVESLKAAQSALILSRISGAELQNTVSDLTLILSSFEDSEVTYKNICDLLIATDAKFSITTNGLIQGLKRLSFKQSNIKLSLSQAIELIAKIKENTGRSECVIGNALKTILTNIQSESVCEKLKSFHIDTKHSDGSFKNMEDILKEYILYKDSTENDRENFNSDISGKYNLNIFKALLNSLKLNITNS